MDLYTLLYFKWITNKNMLYSTRNSAQCMWQPGWEGNFGENGCRYIYGEVPLLLTCNHHSIVNQLYPSIKYKVKKKKSYLLIAWIAISPFHHEVLGRTNNFVSFIFLILSLTRFSFLFLRCRFLHILSPS